MNCSRCGPASRSGRGAARREAEIAELTRRSTAHRGRQARTCRPRHTLGVAEQVRALADRFRRRTGDVAPVASAPSGTDPGTAPARLVNLELLAKGRFLGCSGYKLTARRAVRSLGNCSGGGSPSPPIADGVFARRVAPCRRCAELFRAPASAGRHASGARGFAVAGAGLSGAHHHCRTNRPVPVGLSLPSRCLPPAPVLAVKVPVAGPVSGASRAPAYAREADASACRRHHPTVHSEAPLAYPPARRTTRTPTRGPLNPNPPFLPRSTSPPAPPPRHRRR